MVNQFKTFALMVILTLLLMLVGGAVAGRGGMLFFFFLALVMNFVSYWFSDKIVLAIYRAKEVKREEAPELHRMVETLARRADIPKPKICLMNNPSPNAFATGRDPQHAVVVVSSGIMQLLDQGKLEGVLGHELTHVRNRDILICTIAAAIAGAIMMLSSMARWAAIFGGMGSDREERQGGIALLAVAIFAPLAAILIQLAISRSREYMADEGGGRLAGNPLKLSNALKKLEMGSKRLPLRANPATAHMFIVNPLTGGWLLGLFSTHPPIPTRVAKLEELARRG